MQCWATLHHPFLVQCKLAAAVQSLPSQNTTSPHIMVRDWCPRCKVTWRDVTHVAMLTSANMAAENVVIPAAHKRVRRRTKAVTRRVKEQVWWHNVFTAVTRVSCVREYVIRILRYVLFRSDRLNSTLEIWIYGKAFLEQKLTKVEMDVSEHFKHFIALVVLVVQLYSVSILVPENLILVRPFCSCPN